MTLIVTAPITWLVARVRFSGSRLLLVVVTCRSCCPASSWAWRSGRCSPGPLGFHLLGWAAPSTMRSQPDPHLCAHVFLNAAVVVRVVGQRGRARSGVWSRPRRSGATPWRAFTRQ